MPNPDYDSLVVLYQQANENLQSAGNAYAATPNIFTGIALGSARRRANDIASELAETPRYREVPVYEEYQYKRTDFNFALRIRASYSLTDVKERFLLLQKEFETTGSVTRSAIQGAAPDDVNGLTDSSVDETESERVLTEFRRQKFAEFAGTICDIIGRLPLYRARDSVAAGLPEDAREQLLAYKFLKGLPSQSILSTATNIIHQLGLTSVPEEIDRLLSEKDATGALAANSPLKPDRICKETAEPQVRLPDEFGQLESVLDSWNPLVIEYTAKDTIIVQRAVEDDRSAVDENHSNQTSEAAVETSTNPRVSKVLDAEQVVKMASPAVVVIRTAASTGSGFIISGNGYILTNAHVVRGSEDIKIEMGGGKVFFATVVDMLFAKDLALLKVDAQGLPFLPLGSIANVNVGEGVLAIGAPAPLATGVLQQTVTKGIVSSIRSLPSLANSNLQVQYIQTDAAINPGNSGGPLLNMVGQVIGINSQKVKEEGFQSLGFAIAIDEAKKAFADYFGQ